MSSKTTIHHDKDDKKELLHPGILLLEFFLSIKK